MPKTNKDFKIIFKELYELLAQKYETSDDPIITKIVRKYADVYYDLMREEYIANLKDPALASHKGIIALLNGFDAVKESMLSKTLYN